MKAANPFTEAADALAAHGRQQAGRVVRLLADDPETREEIEAERQRQRVRAWNERKRKEARERGVPVTHVLRARGPDGRFVKS